jgi:hypothetical protein
LHLLASLVDHVHPREARGHRVGVVEPRHAVAVRLRMSINLIILFMSEGKGGGNIQDARQISQKKKKKKKKHARQASRA